MTNTTSMLFKIFQNESYASGLYYEQAEEIKKLNNYLNYRAVKFHLVFRRLVKRIIK